MREPFVFTRLYLRRPIEARVVTNLIIRLASSDVPRPLALEVRADDKGMQYLLGCTPTSIHKLQNLLGGFVPGTTFESPTRTPITAAARVQTTRNGMPASVEAPENLVASLYNEFATRKTGETVALQVVLGGAQGPRAVRPDAPDPLQPMSSRLWGGVKKASPDTRRRLQDHATEPRIQVALRIGVDAATPERREALARGVFGSLQSMDAIGVRLQLVREPASRLNEATPSQMRLELTATELTPILGWPIGDRELPGVEALHPKRLPLPANVSDTESVFATSDGPGTERLIGFETTGRLQHSVCIGPTGSGKSVLLEHLILSDIAAGRACAVIEPKRQLIDSILDRAPASAVGKIVVLDAADPTPVGFNPLELGPDDDPYVVADNLLAAFAALFQDGWGPRTEYLIQGALLTLLIAGSRRGTPYTIIDLPNILTDAALRLEAVKHVQDDTALATFWHEYEEMPVRQRVNQIAAPLNKLRKIVMRKNLVAVLGQPSPRFKLRTLFAGDTTVLVPLNEALIGKGAANFLGSLVLAELWTATLKRATEKDPRRRPGMIFVDEVQNYLHLPTDIGDAMATSRSYGVAWHVAHQFRAQLPSAMREGFDTNARSKFLFALGPKDAADLAKHAPELTSEDILKLGQYEIYCRLVASGGPTDWFSARTLAPSPITGAREAILQACRGEFGMQPATQPDPPAPSPATSTTAPNHGPARLRGQKARRA